jgi:hypothetical protein
MRFDAGEIRVEPTEGAQRPRTDPGRNELAVLQEGVDVDVRQHLRLVGFFLHIVRAAGVVVSDTGRTVILLTSSNQCHALLMH